MPIKLKDIDTEELKNFIRENMRSAMEELVHEMPPTSLEVLVMQQMLDHLRKVEQNTVTKTEFDEFKSDVNQRFDTIDQRFDTIDQRFDTIDQRFVTIDKRFVTIDKRFVTIDQRFNSVGKKIEDIRQDIQDTSSWVKTVIGRMQTRYGKNVENMIAGTLRMALNRKDIRPESIKLRQNITDQEGIIGPIGRCYEIDIMAENSILYIFDIKSYFDPEMAERFNDKVLLAKKIYKDKNVAGIIITLEPEEEIINYCKDNNIMIAK